MTNPTIRVLLVDDDPQRAAEVAGTLEGDDRRPCGVDRAADVAEALDCLAAARYDVVLVDAALARRVGGEAIDQLRAVHGDVAVAVLTGGGEHGLQAGAAMGAHDALPRSELSGELLVRSILRATERGNWLSEAVAQEAAIRTAEARRAAMLDAALDAVITIDERGRIVELNPAASRMFGRLREEMLGREMAPLLIPPRLRDRHERAFARYLETGRSHLLGKRLPLVALRSDGSEFPVELTIARIPTSGPPQLTAYIRDVSEQVRAAEALDEQVRLARLTAAIGVAVARANDLGDMLRECSQAMVTQLDAAFARIWTLDPSGSVLELQASAGMYTHLDGAHGRVPVGALKIGRIAAQRQPHFTNAVVGDPQVSDQEWARREQMVSFAGYPLVCQDRLVGVVAMFARHPLSAVTMLALETTADAIAAGIERCQMAERLRTSEERFDCAVRGSRDGLWDWNVVSGETYLSPRVDEMLGYSPGELPRRYSTFDELLHPDDRSPAFGQLHRSLERREPLVCECRLRAKDGSYRWCCARGQALWNEAGLPYRMAGSLTDITERKQMEAELAERERQFRQAQKLEAVGVLAGGIAHEFNNLLQAISGYTRLAMRELPPESPTHNDLVQVKEAAARGAVLTRQLLGFSRNYVLKRTSVDPNQVVVELAKMLEPLIGEQFEVVTSLDPAAGPLSADPSLLSQMLMNLCINARDAMPDGGRLSLGTRRVELDQPFCRQHGQLRSGAYVVFSVSDTGSGIAPEIRERIFEPFFTTKEVGHGTGLGLAMVYGLVQQHEGAIDVASEVGRGTTIEIYLPLAETAPPALREPQPEAPCGGCETILVADDDPAVRAFVRRVLRGAGYRVLEAASGDEAVAVFEAHRDDVSLALLDAVMPHGTGREAHDRIKQARPSLGVVFCSGYNPDAGQVRILKEQGQRLLSKPFGPETLLRTVREALDTPSSAMVAACPS